MEAATQVPVAPRTIMLNHWTGPTQPHGFGPTQALPTGKTHVEGIGTGASPHYSST